MIGMAETFFYAEAEGLLPTRAGRINAAINEVKTLNPANVDMNVLKYILEKHNIPFNSLTNREKRYIENEFS